MKKRMLSVLLLLALVLSLCPAVLADCEYSDLCVEYIKSHEGFRSMPYGGAGGWYIGYGTACSPADYPGGISEEGAETLLREKLDSFAGSVQTFLDRYDVEATQGQFDALCAMTYNFGPAWLSTANRLPKYIAEGIENYTDQEIVNAFAAWCHVGGSVVEGLLRRRIMEAQMFLYDDYSEDISDWCYMLLDANGGDIVSDVVCFPAGSAPESPEAVRAGYVLAGWILDDGTLLTEDSELDRNRKAVAAWINADELPPEETPEGGIPEETPEEEPEEVPEETPEETPEEPELPVGQLFTDVAEENWFYEYVSDLTAKGVINGFPDGSFRPGEDVSCGQALKLIVMAAGYGEQEPEEDEHWAAGYLRFAEERGFVDEGYYTDLDEPISRYDIADLTAAALELDVWAELEDPFDDTSRRSVLALYEAKIAEGSIENGQRLYKGRDSINRAEMSAIVYRVADYVERTLILFSGHRIPINYNLEMNPYNSELFYSENDRVYYDDPNYDVRYGIDVAFYQGNIDWQAVARDGIDFAIIRAGYRGCSEGVLYTDEKFYDNIEGALRAGLDVGVYFFSQALDADEAAEEAEYALALVAGYDLTLPIAFDWEPLSYSYSRTRTYDYSRLAESAAAFCDTVERAGYDSIIYLNPSFSYLRYDMDAINGYDIWLAHYKDVTDYKYIFNIWQYGSSGSVDGIAGRVDMDILFLPR